MPRNIAGLSRMGAKYLPTIKDRKAGDRFKRQQSEKQQTNAQPKLKKELSKPASPKGEKP
jgi:hypothetical protein